MTTSFLVINELKLRIRFIAFRRSWGLVRYDDVAFSAVRGQAILVSKRIFAFAPCAQGLHLLRGRTSRYKHHADDILARSS